MYNNIKYVKAYWHEENGGEVLFLKKTILILIGVFVMLGLFGCGKQKTPPQNAKVDDMIEIRVLNQIGAADIWVLPNTEENRKTTVWGKAMVSRNIVPDDEGTTVTIPVGTDEYLFRMIDTDEMYYEANGIVLDDHQSLVIREGEEDMTAVVAVYSAEGTLMAEYDVFMARL